MEGPESLRAIIEQLEGFEAPAAAWEGELLPARMVEYDPAWLDALCLSGEVVWARLTPPSRSADNGEKNARLRSSAKHSDRASATQELRALEFGVSAAGANDNVRIFNDHADGLRLPVASRGASFFTDIVENTKLLRSQVEEALAELVANGVVVSDSFAGLRALLTPGSRKTQAAARRKHRQPVYDMASAGRWSILQRSNDNTKLSGSGTERKKSRGRCSSATAWFSNVCWNEKEWRCPGVCCCAPIIDSKRVAIFVADGLSVVFPVNSLLCRKRSECCDRFVVQARRRV